MSHVACNAKRETGQAALKVQAFERGRKARKQAPIHRTKGRFAVLPLKSVGRIYLPTNLSCHKNQPNVTNIPYMDPMG